MFSVVAAFGGFSVDNLEKAKDFYTNTLGFSLDNDEMGLTVALPGGGKVFIYDKPNHQPATYTMLNLVVENIDEAVDELAKKGVKFEQYNMPDIKQDEKGIARGLSAKMGPDIAWFKDSAGNILAVLQNK